MAANLTQLKQTLSVSMLKTSISAQAAQAVVMLEDFTQTQQTVPAPHPTSGHHLDLKA